MGSCFNQANWLSVMSCLYLDWWFEQFKRIHQSWKMENIFTAAKPFLVLLKLFGVFPMTFKGAIRKGYFETTIKDHFYSLCTFGVWLFLIVLNGLYYTSFETSSFMMRNVYKFSLTIGFLSAFIMASYQRCKLSNISKFLSTVKDYDTKVMW